MTNMRTLSVQLLTEASETSDCFKIKSGVKQ